MTEHVVTDAQVHAMLSEILEQNRFLRAEFSRVYDENVRLRRVLERVKGEIAKLGLDLDARPQQLRAREPVVHGPQIRAWRTYLGFRTDMQQREQMVRSSGRWNVNSPIKKFVLASQNGRGDTVRTIVRTMQRYRLDPERDWPPSTWPDEQRP